MKISACTIALIAVALTGLLVVNGTANQQYPAAKGGSSAATMTAKLVDPGKKAAQQAATVEVSTTGIQLIDPATVNEMPMAGQGHLHYQVDKGPVIATPAAKLSFHGLTPGSHTIVVTLAGNDHNPLGPEQRLMVTVPSAKSTPSKPSKY